MGQLALSHTRCALRTLLVLCLRPDSCEGQLLVMGRKKVETSDLWWCPSRRHTLFRLEANLFSAAPQRLRHMDVWRRCTLLRRRDLRLCERVCFC